MHVLYCRHHRYRGFSHLFNRRTEVYMKQSSQPMYATYILIIKYFSQLLYSSFVSLSDFAISVGIYIIFK